MALLSEVLAQPEHFFLISPRGRDENFHRVIIANCAEADHDREMARRWFALGHYCVVRLVSGDENSSAICACVLFTIIRIPILGFSEQLPRGNPSRLECSPPLAFGLGTGSQEFSTENSCSAVRFPLKTTKQKKNIPIADINLSGGDRDALFLFAVAPAGIEPAFTP